MSESGGTNAAQLLRSHGIRPRHRLGQNFLEDEGALEGIAAAAGMRPDDTVLEIGCGFGSLTRHLARLAATVIAVELDGKLAALAAQLLRPYGNVRVICGDILALSPAAIGLGPAYVVAANIPYYVTSPIMRHLLESDPKPRRIVLTVQQEVAQRVCARPPDMSLLALSVQVYGKAEIVARISAQAFFPAPKVDSAVVRVEAYKSPLIPPLLLPHFFKLAKASFLQRRKTLRNSLASGLNITPAEAAGILTAAGIDPQRRAQTLDLPEWEVLAREAERRLT